MFYVVFILICALCIGATAYAGYGIVKSTGEEIAAKGQPTHKLKKRYAEIRELILEEVEQEDEASLLLDDCEEFLDSIILSYKRLEALKGMSEDAQELVDTPNFIGREHEKLEQRITKSLETFMRQLYQVSTEITFDRTNALDRLSSFTEDIKGYREALEEVQRGIVLGESERETVLDLQPKTETVEV